MVTLEMVNQVVMSKKTWPVDFDDFVTEVADALEQNRSEVEEVMAYSYFNPFYDGLIA